MSRPITNTEFFFMFLTAITVASWFTVLITHPVKPDPLNTDCYVYSQITECLYSCGCGWCQRANASSGSCFAFKRSPCFNGIMNTTNDAHCESDYKHEKKVNIIWISISVCVTVITCFICCGIGLFERIKQDRHTQQVDEIAMSPPPE
jgi:hypothetical protein